MTKVEKKLFEITVWYRYVIAGEQEKDFEVHEIEAVDVQDAVNKASDMYNTHRAIPFAFYEGNNKDVKLKPNNFSKEYLFNLTSPLV